MEITFILYTILIMYLTGVIIHAPVVSNPIIALIWPVAWAEFIRNRQRSEELKEALFRGIVEIVKEEAEKDESESK